MQDGIILNQSDIKEILAEFFDISKDVVINIKYSFIITEESEVFKKWKMKKENS